MKGSMMDYVISLVAETPIMDVYHYQQAVPEHLKKIED